MKKNAINFKRQLKKYLSISGLNITVYLKDGKTIELDKNRSMNKNEIIAYDQFNQELRIPIETIESVDLFAA